jgi:hypothetical protein
MENIVSEEMYQFKVEMSESVFFFLQRTKEEEQPLDKVKLLFMTLL